jgi:hypothetical protein
VGEGLPSRKDSDTCHFLVLKRVRKPHPNLFKLFNVFFSGDSPEVRQRSFAALRMTARGVVTWKIGEENVW